MEVPDMVDLNLPEIAKLNASCASEKAFVKG